MTKSKVLASESPTFTDRLRKIFQKSLEAIASLLLKTGLTPNAITIIGCLGTLIASVLIARGHLTWGGLVALFWVVFDAFDGTMARLSGKVSQFGAFLDSSLDRYAELFLLGGLLVHFMANDQTIAALLTFTAAGGSLMVSYTRARAQSLGYEAKIGFLSRVERFIVLIPSLLFHIPLVAVAILAVFTNLTAVQRMLHVYRASRGE
ncbi:MAG: CDP-alcohol phosphatidyltransferase family protein [Anaerolineae bacterium]|nr:CDP-alcohol phosphatidyltransferase family protein [Anaerolineae bacterium]